MDCREGPLDGVLDTANATAAALVTRLVRREAEPDAALDHVRALCGDQPGWETLLGMAVAAHAAARLDPLEAGALVRSISSGEAGERNPLAATMLSKAVQWRADGNTLPSGMDGHQLLAMLLECGDDRDAFVACVWVITQSESRLVTFDVMLDAYASLRRARHRRGGVEMLASLGEGWAGTLAELEETVAHLEASAQ